MPSSTSNVRLVSRRVIRANVARATVADFEREVRTPIPNNLTAIQNALEEGGIEFIPNNGGGVGVRFR